MAGIEWAGSQQSSKPKPAPTSLFGNPASFTAAANTQASDYDSIMKGYANMLNKSNSGAGGLNSITGAQNKYSPQMVNAPANVAPQMLSAPTNIPAQLSQYDQSSDVTNSLAGLSDLATTGGYSPEGIADIRARSISPTRSIYANAQRNTERQRSLQGGYSPNFNAVQAKMAREESDQIGNINTNVNAEIAQNVASNRLSAAPNYASASAQANAAKTSADQRNADIINMINEANAGRGMQVGQFNANTANQVNEGNAGRGFAVNMANADAANRANQFNAGNNTQAQSMQTQAAFDALRGMTSLYGTTPALTNTFGDQVGQAANMSQNQQQINQQTQRNSNILPSGYRS